MLSKPRLLLYLEGGALFGSSIFAYHQLGASWGFFLALFLWPDISMLGYIANPRLGASLYNLVHCEALPLAAAVLSYAVHRNTALAFSFIWLAHIGFDRVLGFGLKYPTFFKDTHLQRVG